MKNIVNFYTTDGIKHYINIDKFVDISFQKHEHDDVFDIFILMEHGSNLSCQINKANYDSFIEQLYR